MRKCKNSDDDGNNIDASMVSEDFASSDVLTISVSRLEDERVMDSKYSFRMCPNKIWFQKLIEVEGGQFLLGNNHNCKVRAIGEIKLSQMTQ